ncbi:MAG: ribbon-helix-helix domain-containing protein, partial [Bdellovibrionales bacterium]
MASENVNIRMDKRMIDYIDSFISPNGTYESRSEFIRDMIRKSMNTFPPERAGKDDIAEGILEGYRDILEGRVIKYSGSLWKDLETFRDY